MGPAAIHHVEPNAPHGVKNVGATTGRVLLLFHPADLLEGSFKDLGKPSTATALPAPVPPGPPPPEVLQPWKWIFEKHKPTLPGQPKF